MRSVRKLQADRNVLAVMGAVTLTLLASSAQGGADAPLPAPEKGYALAQKLCVSCHLTGDDTGAAVPAGVPSFRGIANKPGQTGQHILDVLLKPHPPMPDIQLSREEMLNILAYLELLRTDSSTPPLLVPDQPKTKPEYPDHS